MHRTYLDTIAPIYVPVVRETKDRKRPLSTPAPSSPAIRPIDVSHVLPISLGTDILHTPSATIPLSNIAAIDICGELDESGHKNDDDDMSCSQNTNHRNNCLDNSKKCVVCLHKMRDDRSRCHDCRKPLHTSLNGLSCYNSVNGVNTNSQSEK